MMNEETLQEKVRRAALAALAYARSHIKITNTDTASNELPADVRASLHTIIDNVRVVKAKNYHLLHDAKFSDFISVVINTRTYAVGNCREYTYLGLYYLLLRNKSLPFKVEAYEIINGDHAFLVLGRKHGSDTGNYRTWGPNAMICDAWRNLIYPAAELSERLHDRKIKLVYQHNSEHDTIEVDKPLDLSLPEYCKYRYIGTKNATEQINLDKQFLSRIPSESYQHLVGKFDTAILHTRALTMVNDKMTALTQLTDKIKNLFTYCTQVQDRDQANVALHDQLLAMIANAQAKVSVEQGKISMLANQDFAEFVDLIHDYTDYAVKVANKALQAVHHVFKTHSFNSPNASYLSQFSIYTQCLRIQHASKNYTDAIVQRPVVEASVNASTSPFIRPRR